ncbi:nuclear pore complex protein NUP50A-like [Rosa rugosa]|uniref:nuclear pore complex protein NUP50A-like n=1 Tax=Rosa rugosa TaxID=74645 RepID=UPI002B40CDD0|nr:nuclear pore complex protein NUP50A-like [Rosa rugosa]XP_062008305.1 nuclear pore complex protein NUP50A-like [Rosa rugosa]
MADSENALPPSKKRAAGRELSRDNPGLDDEEDSSELETGTFKRASEEVLATRKIVKVRRPPTSSGPSSNPFAGIRLVPPSEASADPSQAATDVRPASEAKVSDDANQQSDSKPESAADKESDVKEEDKIPSEATEPGVAHDQTEAESAEDKENIVKENSNISSEPAVGEDKTKNDGEAENEVKTVTDGETGNVEKSENEEKREKKDETVDPCTEGATLNSFQQLSSSQNAFTNLSGTGFSTSTFSFGLISKDGSSLSTGTGSLFGSKNDLPSGLGLSNNGSSSLFATAGPSIVSRSDTPSMQEVAVETGEENEKAVFTADAVLFEFIDGGWKERGKGDLKVNVSESGADKARLVMRAKGIRKVILNASLYPDMKLANMEKKGVTFACMNSIDEKKDGLSTFALKFKDGSIVEEFRSAVTEHKGKTATAMKTPENSPK